jgi:acetyl esterase/lipase
VTGRDPLADLIARRVRPPDRVLRYGDHPAQLIDVRRETADPGAPVVVLLHGGFWRAAYDRLHTRPMADDLVARGYTVCSPEYRRVGDPGGGHPGTFDDVAAAVDMIVDHLVPGGGSLHGSPGGGVVLLGHSAGGHLALWSALRHRLPGTSPWRRPPSIRGVVALAPVSDLGGAIDENLGGGAARALLTGRATAPTEELSTVRTGGPAEVSSEVKSVGPSGEPTGEPPGAPDGELVRKLAETDPVRLLPFDHGRLVLVHGAQDAEVPIGMSRRFAAREPAAELVELPCADHFDVIDPLSPAWPAVLDALSSVLAAPQTPHRPWSD